MFADRDFRKPASSKQPREAIVPQLLSLTFSMVSHQVPRPFRKFDRCSGLKNAWTHSTGILIGGDGKKLVKQRCDRQDGYSHILLFSTLPSSIMPITIDITSFLVVR
jgi:hypothetical protein